MAERRGKSPSKAFGAAVWLLASIGPTAGSAASPEGFRVTRPVDVDRPGLVRLNLELDDVREMLPAAADLHLFSPSGQELPYRHVLGDFEERRTPLRLLAVERRETGWRIRLDAGSDPRPHRALLFEMQQTALASGVRLESSSDGERWRLLAEGDLFRIGDEREMLGATLGYPPTSDRFLSLDWPEPAGFPEAERIALERSPERPIAQRVTSPEPRPPGDTEYRLRCDAGLARRLSLELSGEGTAGYRLTRARDRAWQPLAAGAWRLEPGVTALRVVPLPASERPCELRLELYGGAATPPELAAYAFDYPSQTVFFRAVTAGRYTLAYGGERRSAPGRLDTAAAELRHALRIEPGPAERHPPPPLSGPAVEARTSLPTAAFSARWQVRAPAAAGGSVVRLELPADVLRASREDLADLRLAVDERQLPFLRWQPAAPVAAAGSLRDGPQPGAEAGTSILPLALPEARFLQVDLTTVEGPFRRLVGARFRPDPGRKLGAPAPRLTRREWRCPPREAVPCRLSLELRRATADSRDLELEFEDGDNPPLGELRIDLWRTAPHLVFVWPARGVVHLVSGSPELASPDYDIQLMREEILHRSWIAAELDLAAAARSRAKTDRWGRLLLLGVLAVAALFLLVLLARLLRPFETPRR